MRDPQTLQVEGESYLFAFLDTTTAAETFTEIAKLGLPTVATGIKELLGDLDLEKTGDMEVKDFLRDVASGIDLTALASSLSMSLEPKAVGRVIKTLCSCVHATNGGGQLQGPVYENHFKGRPGHALLVAIESFKVNGGGHFFGSAASLGGLLKKTATTQGPTASIG